MEIAVDKAFEGKSLKELADAPIYAIKGVSESDAKKLEEAFGIKSIKAFANLKYLKVAQAIVSLAEAE